jgi:hypothetical protein
MTMSQLRANPTSQIVFFCLLVAAACLPGTIAFAQGDVQSDNGGTPTIDQLASQVTDAAKSGSLNLNDLAATTPVSQPVNNTIDGSSSSARMTQEIQNYEKQNQNNTNVGASSAANSAEVVAKNATISPFILMYKNNYQQYQQMKQEMQQFAKPEDANFLSNLVNLTAINVEQHTGGKAGEAYESRRDTRLIYQALRGLRDTTSSGGGGDASGGQGSGGAGGQADVAPDGFVSLGNIDPGVQSELPSIAAELSNSTALLDFASAGGAQVPISFLPIYQNDPLSNYSAPSSAGLEGFDPTTGQYFLNGNLNNNIGVQYQNTNISPPSASLCGQ